jgi:hypothetical protein
MPHFEKVTQIKTDYPVATPIGGQNGVNPSKKKSRYKAGPFLLPESRTERKVSHPGRIALPDTKTGNTPCTFSTSRH